MRLLNRLAGGLRALLRRSREDEELDEELRAFLAASIEAKVAAGATPSDARRAAMREIGSQAAVKDWVKDVGWEAWLETFARDVGYAFRLLRRDRRFAFVAVVTLALGIGVNTAIFTLADGMLFRPLPYRAPDRLVLIQPYNPKTGQVYGRIDRVDVEEIEAHHSGLAGLALLETGPSYTWLGTDGTDAIGTVTTTSNFLGVLGVGAALGRPIAPGDERIEPRPVMLAYDAWQRRFGGDPAAVGRTIAFNERTLQIVGVLPADFLLPPESGVSGGDLLVPEPPDPNEVGNPRAGTWAPVARLKPGVSVRAAQAETDLLMARMRIAYPKLGAERALRVADLQYGLFELLHPRLWLLIGASAFVTLIAFTNLASLLMARGAARRQEMGIRAAIGASRGRLVRQLLVESEVIAILGAIAGFAFASWIFELLAARVPQGSFLLLPDRVDARALTFAIASALACGAVFGVLPALRVSKADLEGALRGRLRPSAPGARRAGAALVTAEVALGLVLLCGAALMANSLVRAQTVDLGYEPSRTVAMSLFPPVVRYPTAAQRYDYWMTALDQVRRVAGVAAAGAIDYLPVGGVAPPNGLGATAPRGSGLWGVTPDYFAAMQTPFVEGRTFTAREAVGDVPVAIVNQTAARFFWPEERAVVGRVLRLEKVPPMQIVGVVKDARYGYGREASLSVYRPSGPEQRMLTIVARANGDPAAVAALMRTAAQRIDPRIVVRMPRTIESVLQQGRIAETRFQTTLFVLFAALGCCLTAVGVYGVIGYWVSGRTQEMGIRLALGANPRRLQGLVLAQAARPLAIGVALGLGGAFVLTRQLQSLLYGITPHDPTTLAGATVLLLLVGLAAAWLPARRASRVDPLVALKAE